ncbi:hypothetical protein O9993_11355 [Vibrio lentus]|nr:hypothetical protein [Vibrio lentus]
MQMATDYLLQDTVLVDSQASDYLNTSRKVMWLNQALTVLKKPRPLLYLIDQEQPSALNEQHHLYS